MSWRTNPYIISLRNFGRQIGLNRLMLKNLSPAKYEQQFETEMLKAARKDDCVWDVGANVGFYSKQFSQLAGPNGKVYAFEPSPVNLKQLQDAVNALSNVIILPVALGNQEGQVPMEQGTDELGATSRLTAVATSPTAALVKLTTGDQLIASRQAQTPNVIKIDTEGFELDVLQGLDQTLRDKKLRVLCIEVHFRLLEERGFNNAPGQIERILDNAGFTVVWPDFSHIVATRLN